MTQPVQEPTQGRTDQAQEYRTRQLFRRPGPPAPAGGDGPVMYDMGTTDIEVFSGTDPSGYDSQWFLSWDGVTPPATGSIVWGWISVGISDIDNGGTDGTGSGGDSRGYEIRVVPSGFSFGAPLGGYGRLQHLPNAAGTPTDIDYYNIYPEVELFGDRFILMLTNYKDTTVGRTPVSTGVVKPSWPFPTGTAGAPGVTSWFFSYWYTQPAP